jgi:hypothetical protein
MASASASAPSRAKTSTYLNEGRPDGKLRVVLGSGDVEKIRSGDTKAIEKVRKFLEQDTALWVTAGPNDLERHGSVMFLWGIFEGSGPKYDTGDPPLIRVMTVAEERDAIMAIGSRVVELAFGSSQNTFILTTGGSTFHAKCGDTGLDTSGDPAGMLVAVEATLKRLLATGPAKILLGGAFRFAVPGGAASPGEVKPVTELDPQAVAKNPAAKEVCEYLNSLLGEGKIEVAVGSSKHS